MSGGAVETTTASGGESCGRISAIVPLSSFVLSSLFSILCQESVGDDDEGCFFLSQTSSNLRYPKGNFGRCLTERLARSVWNLAICWEIGVGNHLKDGKADQRNNLPRNKTMSLIYFEFNNAITFESFVSAPGPNGIWYPSQVPAIIPQGPGIYVILNSYGQQNPYNRYIGISQNLYQRFGTRQATLVELGFTQQQLNEIWLYWGNVTWWNTAQLYAPNPIPQGGAYGPWNAVGGIPQLPNGGLPVGNAHGQGGLQPFTGQVDGQLVNFENLLIRFFLGSRLLDGTVTNTLLTGNITNNTPYNMRVIIGYPTAVGGGVAESLDATLYTANNAGLNQFQTW